MLKVNELFSGIGSQNSALKRLAIDYEITTTSDLDTHAIISYAAIHCGLMEKLKDYDFPSGEEMADYLLERNVGWNFKNNKPYNWKRFIDKITGKGKKDLKKAYLATVLSNNAGDISKIDKLDYADFWTYSFPCQDISVAGKQAGIEKHTRSGLLYEVERLLRVSAEHGELPKYLMLENVKNLVGKKFKAQFDEWLEYLDELGYNTYWQVLNAKNYGIPQNRERVFAISIRKDVDTGDFSFPEGFDNGLRLKDFLENEVDEKFYISNEKTGKLIKQLDFKNKELLGIDLTINKPKFKDYANCIKARYDAGVSNQRTDGTGVCEPMLFGGEQKNQAIKTDGISTCLTSSMGMGGGYVPMVTEACIPCITPDREEKRQNGRRFKEDGDPMFTLTGQDRHGVLTVGQLDGTNFNQNKTVYDTEGIAPTLIGQGHCGNEPKVIQVGNIVDTGNWENPQRGRIYSAEGCSPSLNTVGGGGLEPKILRPVRTEYGKAIRKQYEAGEIEESRHNMTELKPREDGVSNTLTTVQKDNLVLEKVASCNQAVIEPVDLEKYYLPENSKDYSNYDKSKVDKSICPINPIQIGNSVNFGNAVSNSDVAYTIRASQPNGILKEDYRIRKLTPLECWRLMGFADEEFQKAQDAGVSNSQLYKQAGNSIVVEVLEGIFKQMF